MKDVCSRCKKEIYCNVDDIENCQCSTIKLKSSTKLFLKKTHYKCLCNDCLEKLDYFDALNEQYKSPKTPSEFIEHIHYYIENGLWVFTEFFHYQKGECCKNNCRHCAYGYQR